MKIKVFNQLSVWEFAGRSGAVMLKRWNNAKGKKFYEGYSIYLIYETS